MAARKKTRKHRGVVLMRPDETRGIWWRARYPDPDTGKVRAETLPRELTTDDQRRDWAARKSVAIAKRGVELLAGAERAQRVNIDKAVEDYFEVETNRLRPATITLYRTAASSFVSWAAAKRIVTTDKLTRTALPGYRDHLLGRRKSDYVPGGKRGERVAGEGRLSPATLNWHLRGVSAMLNSMRVRGVVPLSSDAIRDALKPFTLPRESPEFLRTGELRALLEACLVHDAETFSETRSEHRGKGIAGSTPRYQPIAPLVLTALLCGFRFEEALKLRWDGVDLAVAEIALKGAETKTKIARTVRLDVSPSVRDLLEQLRRVARGPYVFPSAINHRVPLTKTAANAARKRLAGTYGAPASFGWQILRSTAATYQTNAFGLFGESAAFASAKRLGHSVEVAEKHYTGLVQTPRDARTLEECMGMGDLAAAIVEAARVRAEG